MNSAQYYSSWLTLQKTSKNEKNEDETWMRKSNICITKEHGVKKISHYPSHIHGFNCVQEKLRTDSIK